MIIYAASEAETEAAGVRLAGRLKPGVTVAFYGPMGAGKTTFIRGLARGLGVSDRVTSPTYTIVNEYEGTLPLFHFDMYRLASAEELFDIGWEDYRKRGGVLAVEWSENVESALDRETIRVRLAPEGENVRKITIEMPEGEDML